MEPVQQRLEAAAIVAHVSFKAACISCDRGMRSSIQPAPNMESISLLIRAYVKLRVHAVGISKAFQCYASYRRERYMTVQHNHSEHSIQTMQDDPFPCTDLCSDLLASVAELARWEGALDGDMDARTIEDTLNSARLARLSCDKVAAALQQVYPAAGSVTQSNCEALRQYMSLAAIDEFEFPETHASRHKCRHSPRLERMP